MSRLLPLALIVATVACTQDTGVAVHNSPPEVAFILPVEGSWAYVGVTVEFVATITDDLTANEDMTLTWASDLDGYLPGEEVLEGETVTLTVDAGLSSGFHTVTLSVVDGDGETSEDQVGLEVVPNTTPECSFTKPRPGSVFSVDDVIEVVAYVQDDEDTDNLDLLTVVWGGYVEGMEGLPEHPDNTGRARFDLEDTPVGSYNVSYEAADLGGSTCSASASFSVE